MVGKITWTKRAVTKFNKIVAYLEPEWGTEATQRFVIRTYKIINLLAERPGIGTLEDSKKQIRGFVLTKHNRLFYRITDEGIILLNFYDTRSGLKRKKF